MAKAKYDYVMDYISDRDTFKAVMWACNMIREGASPSIAIRRASRYYGVDMSDVVHYVGQRGSRVAHERRK